MRPLIIISPSVNESADEIKLAKACFRAVDAAGGLALASDHTNAKELAEKADGILLSGGGDIEPSLTSDKADIEHQGFICLERDRFEIELVKRAVEIGVPILGICRGAQIIGAAFGGHIIQHIDGHSQAEPKFKTTHYINIEENTMLFKIIGTGRISVNSFHHQALGDGSGLKVSAEADDKIVEAIEGQEENFVLGVQWHPEFLCEDELQMRIFKAFVRASWRYRYDMENTILRDNGSRVLYGSEAEQKNNR